MPVKRNSDGQWEITKDESGKTDFEDSHFSYRDALPKYLTAFERLFFEAREKCDFEFINCLLRVRGLVFGNYDPYETTLDAIPRINKVHEKIKSDFIGARHLHLWIYGHIVEASEPYELIMNLIKVRNGLQFHRENFPDRKGGRPQSPGEKIAAIEKEAINAGLTEIGPILKEIWNRDLRNSIFHSDYVLLGSSVRLPKVGVDFTHDQILTYLNRALAYHEVLAKLQDMYREDYSEPIQIPVHPNFSDESGLMATVMIREGHGVIGIKDSYTREELAKGHIPFMLGKFSSSESQLIEKDRFLAKFPPLKKRTD